MKSVCAVCLICGLAVSVRAADSLQRGVNLPLWNDDLTGLGASLDQFKADGGTYVSVNVVWFQDTINSTVIAPNYNLYSAHDATVRTALQAIRARGMTAVLKPLVDLGNDAAHWRGQIVGGDTWFNNAKGYRAFASHFADLAEQESAQLMVVGTELGGTVGQSANWRNAIGDVKGRFSGQLTYAANAGDAVSVLDNQVGWWDALDYIGIDAYYALTNVNNPSPAALKAAWSNQAANIRSWHNALPANQQKPVLFTEVGYPSQDGANREPWNWTVSNQADPQEQADCYDALLSQVWGKESWFQGAYWWNWEVSPTPNEPLGYTPQNKPAEAVLKSYYSVPAALPGDANGDGVVDLQDFSVLRAHFGAVAGATWATGDFTGDGAVTLDDAAILQGHFGETAALVIPNPLTAVPEPTSAALLLLVLTGSFRRLRRRTPRRCA